MLHLLSERIRSRTRQFCPDEDGPRHETRCAVGAARAGHLLGQSAAACLPNAERFIGIHDDLTATPAFELTGTFTLLRELSCNPPQVSRYPPCTRYIKLLWFAAQNPPLSMSAPSLCAHIGVDSGAL